jgi:predicted HicB family RNase H-like nuclease
VSNATQPFQARLQFIRVLVSYEGDTVAELSQAFRDAVDDYLSTCESLGREAEVPCKGSLNVRIGHDLHLAASVAATRQSISLNDLTRKAQSEYLEHHA